MAARAAIRARARRLLGGVLAVLLGACASVPPEAPAPPRAPVRYPASVDARATTSSDIYLGNLDSRIASLRGRTDAPGAHALLAAALHARFRIVGRIADAEAALAEARQAVLVAPDHADAHRVLAATLMSFHLFEDAAKALDAAESLGAEVAGLRRDLWMALGRYDLLQPDFAASNLPVGDFQELAHRADLRLMLGDPAGAFRWYRAAQDLYPDVDPYPLAWLHTQQGIALLRHGDCASARVFFETALQRLPQYYLAAEHLAECEATLGQLAPARQRYHAVIEQTGNPEFLAALADVETAAGATAAAAVATEKARAGFADLLARHPAAYAQHAAEFYLDRGESGRALALAQENARLRVDIGSLILLARSAAAAGEDEIACASAQRARATGLQPPELAEIVPIEAACKDQK
ncbi:MAG: tetratricopeptide repeat protein [Rhodanobacteraceae bacterium]|nr:tetratricopeptide repeat protein [Rhodanobacteraceae bacterium]